MTRKGRTRTEPSGGRSVFINCPYDPDYRERMWALAFAVQDCRHQPVTALDIDNASRQRLEKLKAQIQHCRFSIHDLSRATSPRFNMPFEFGMALGMAFIEDQKHSEKAKKIDGHRQILVVAELVKQVKTAASDLEGLEIQPCSDAGSLCNTVGHWLLRFKRRDEVTPKPNQVQIRFDDFWRKLTAQAPSAGIDVANASWLDIKQLTRDYIEANPPQPQGAFNWEG